MNIQSEYICGNKFIDIVDYAITSNDFNIDVNQLKRDCLVFVKTDKLSDFFNIVRDLPYRYIIITHNSDHNITADRYEEKPQNVLHWFAQNVLVTQSDITPIPIGLENPGVGGSGDISILDQEKESTKTIFCYCNISPSTNPSERTFSRDKPFITNQVQRVSFREYIASLSKSIFTISPPGNGADCHRTWEALYMSSIPIVKSSAMTKFFSDFLPMVVLDDLNTISVQQLHLVEKYESLDEYPALKQSFWNALILDKKRKLLS